MVLIIPKKQSQTEMMKWSIQDLWYEVFISCEFSVLGPEIILMVYNL